MDTTPDQWSNKVTSQTYFKALPFPRLKCICCTELSTKPVHTEGIVEGDKLFPSRNIIQEIYFKGILDSTGIILQNLCFSVIDNTLYYSVLSVI